MEALVSLLLLSFILLIFNASGWSILRETRVDYYFHLASLQFKNIEERLRATKRYAGFEDQVALWQFRRATGKSCTPRTSETYLQRR